MQRLDTATLLECESLSNYLKRLASPSHTLQVTNDYGREIQLDFQENWHMQAQSINLITLQPKNGFRSHEIRPLISEDGRDSTLQKPKKNTLKCQGPEIQKTRNLTTRIYDRNSFHVSRERAQPQEPRCFKPFARDFPNHRALTFLRAKCNRNGRRSEDGWRSDHHSRKHRANRVPCPSLRTTSSQTRLFLVRMAPREIVTRRKTEIGRTTMQLRALRGKCVGIEKRRWSLHHRTQGFGPTLSKTPSPFPSATLRDTL